LCCPALLPVSRAVSSAPGFFFRGLIEDARDDAGFL
jgi:hypothetical protein